MRFPLRVAAGLASIGWLAPFIAALYLVVEALMGSRIQAFLGRAPAVPPEIKFYVNALCVIGVLWLATVVTGWAAYFTRRRA